MARYRSFRDLDWPLLIITLIVSALGVLQIYSATHDTKWHNAWWKQVLWIVIGVGIMWVVTSIDYHTLLGQAPLFYGLSIAALLATLAIGDVVFHSRRWITIPGFGFPIQISEFAKVVIVLVVARYLSELKSDQIGLRDLLKLGGLVGIPALLVMSQPDFGTGATYVPILAAGVLLAGLRWQYVAAMVIVGALALPVGWYFLKDYQRERISTFRDPRFLPVPHTDFIFAAFAEEHGFVGVVVVLGLYFLLLMQIVQNAQMAPDRAGMYICMGVATLLLFHLLVNVGMVVGFMPVTGIPLPLMSSGGSNTFSIFMMLGLVNNVRLRRFAS